MSNNEMSAKIRELRELQQLIEEATAEAEAIGGCKTLELFRGISRFTILLTVGCSFFGCQFSALISWLLIVLAPFFYRRAML